MPGVPCPTSGSSLLNLPLSGSAPFGGCRSLLTGLLPLSCPAVTPDPVFTYCPKTLGRSLGLACNTASHRPFADGAGRTRVFASPGWVHPPAPFPAPGIPGNVHTPPACSLSTQRVCSEPASRRSAAARELAPSSTRGCGRLQRASAHRPASRASSLRPPSSTRAVPAEPRASRSCPDHKPPRPRTSPSTFPLGSAPADRLTG